MSNVTDAMVEAALTHLDDRVEGGRCGEMVREMLEAALAKAWRPIETAPRPDEDRQPPVMLLRNSRRYIGEWDPDSGYFFAYLALDGIEPGNEFPGRLYGTTHWQPLPPPPAPEAERG